MEQITHFDTDSVLANTKEADRNRYYKVPVKKLVLFFLYKGK